MSTSNARRRQILAFIRERIESYGSPPSLEEIAASSGLKSRSAAQKHVKALEASGELEATPGKMRSVRPRQSKSKSAGLTGFFEVDAPDVAALSDSDLRELVARLCMASLADVALPSAAVRWGGDQRAPDGGIDVRVRLPPSVELPPDFLNRNTGFQVKATRMGPADIRMEMCPGGMLRPSIQDLARANGSYIIAASDSVSDSELQKRVGAMREAISVDDECIDAHVEYFDSRRLADWTNRHPGVVAWVRSRLSRPLQGWQPYGQWAMTRSSTPQPFLPDASHRLGDPFDLESKFTLVDGLVHVRRILRVRGSSVRLTGLSGVGKTRFAQALFEADASPNPIAPELAVYTDSSHNPNPPPLAVMDEILTSGRVAVLVVDNCSSQLHGQLTSRCRGSNKVSLLTIEYDIREDVPNETTVFRLEKGSSELVESVVEQQFPKISQVNIATITAFADGNSRVAIALANTLERNESLAGLKHRELFDRLFWLGKETQQELLNAARACALVYSFDGEDADGELVHLSALAESTVTSLFRNVSELERRGLVQRRGAWRAVLPHAIANTLAMQALESIPVALLNSKLVLGQDRLLRSFSRRLGYLHESPYAAKLAREWLSTTGILGDLTSLESPLGEVLTNIAPIDTEATLVAIERAIGRPGVDEKLSADSQHRTRLARLARSIAYEPRYFERCMDVLLKIALMESPDNRVNSTREVISSIFHIYLSGTNATLEQRLCWLSNSLQSSDENVVAIGLKCLEAGLQCDHFSSYYGFEFGARSRDYGLSPRGEAAHLWFAKFIKIATESAQQANDLGVAVRDLLAIKFRSLWMIARMEAELEESVRILLSVGWEKGWNAIRQTIRYHSKEMAAGSLERLRALEAATEPSSLIGRTRAVVLSGNSFGVEFVDGESAADSYRRANILAVELGVQVSRDPDSFKSVVPLLFKNQHGRQGYFGEGLAAGAESIPQCWAALIEGFESVPIDERNIQALTGFMGGVHTRDRQIFEHLLDSAAQHPAIAKWVPALQLSAPLDDVGCRRLLSCMDNPAVPAWVFQYLAYGRATDHLSDESISELLQRLGNRKDGIHVALEVLSMHIHDNEHPIGDKLRRVARSLILAAPLDAGGHNLDHTIARLIRFFFEGQGSREVREMLFVIRRGLEDYTLSRHDLSETLAALAEVSPLDAMDILVGDEEDQGDSYIRRRALAGGHRSSAFAGVPIEKIIQWCGAGGADRWSTLAELIPAFDTEKGSGTIRWSSKVVALLESAPEKIEVAHALINLIEPMSWTGSRAEAIKQRLPLLAELEQRLQPQHAGRVEEWRRRINRSIEREERRELEQHRIENERFE